MSGHTRGPWRAEANRDDAMVFAGEDTLIADLWPMASEGEPIHNESERTANAKLIAAAPALADLVFELTDKEGGSAIGCRATVTYEAAPNGSCDCWTCDWARRGIAALRAAGRLP